MIKSELRVLSKMHRICRKMQCGVQLNLRLHKHDINAMNMQLKYSIMKF